MGNESETAFATIETEVIAMPEWFSQTNAMVPRCDSMAQRSQRAGLWCLVNLLTILFWYSTNAGGQDRSALDSEKPAQTSPSEVAGSSGTKVTKQRLFASDQSQLPRGAIKRMGSCALLHSNRISSIRFSPDDEYLATADTSGVVRLWETKTGRLILEKANGGGRKLAFAPDGKTIAIGGYYNRQIILWDIASNEYFGSLAQNARCLEYSHDGSILYAAGQDKIVRAWNVKERKLIREFKGHEAELYALAISPDGELIASAGGYGGYSRHNEIRLWNARTGELVGILDDDLDYYEKLPDAIYALSFSADGKTLASAGPYVSRLWDVPNTKLIDRLSDITADIEFSPHEDRLVAARMLSVYDLNSRQPLFKFGKETRGYGVVEYSHDGMIIATGHDDGKVQLWNSQTGKELKLRRGHEGGVRGVSVSADGKLAASVSREDRTIRIWGLRTGKELIKSEMPWKGSDVWWNEEGSGVMFAPYGRQVFTWSYDGSVTIWSLAQDSKHQVRIGNKRITALAFSPDGHRVAAMEYDSGSRIRVSVYEMDGGKLLALIDPFLGNKNTYDRWISSMAFSPDGNTLALGALADSIRDQPADSVQIWDLEKVERVQQTRMAVAPPGKLLYSPNGRWLASSSSRGADLEIRDVKNLKVIQSFKMEIDAHGRDPAPMAFSADGKLFAAANAKREIFIWETLTWKKIRSFQGHLKAVTEIQFAPDGGTLISSSEDGTLLVWEVNQAAAKVVGLTQVQLDEYWKVLADRDGDLAGLAMNLLIQSPQAAVSLFDEKLDVGSELDKQELPRLISQLKQPDPKVHLTAILKIREYGKVARSALFNELSKKMDDAATARIEGLLETLHQFPVSAKELRRRRSIQILERIGSEEAKRILKKLAESEIRSPACLDAEAALQRLRKLERLNR